MVLSVVPHKVLFVVTVLSRNEANYILCWASKYCLTVSYREGILSPRKRLVDLPQQRLVGLTERGRHIHDFFLQRE